MKNLSELRENIGLTQKEVAEKIGISYKTYNHYETSRSEPDINTLTQLADFFGCSIDYLVGHSEADGVVYSVTTSAPELSTEEQELLDGFRQLTPAMKGRILGNMQGLLQAAALTTITGKRKV